ncbi:phosphate-starvation-inducible protein PsiE [Listeria booriae]|uniref:Protein PsiE n=1 Tax=Listeria booriae TaxID=1552123 RepID=A0A7X1CCI3_9LIST|nr:phosphate-starvation-inducible protein PsiE [Listeria booriae]MBC1492482.1 phosphate-starvation-inducible protein PsiE [Listeria booriae]MBC1504916.1 phosphate-starvation-inducible protein PsiE [Listeria booriae]MBC1511886.1 phosphate-starvation-inducible protein PsiE [Listeria booriae]MBC1525565.1 phosphate-starvation-inducible protein PsiE [Listeria booriae]MBC1530376.1 phosphate-starvation-inducible protein PsiE [Listeria booriae]
MNFIKKWSDKTPKILQAVLNVALILVAMTLVISMFKETWEIFHSVFYDTSENFYQITEEILVFFLYFEFLALIIKYFEKGYHFPLRYFIYIGITAIVRYIIIDHKSAMTTLLLSGAILVLLLSLLVANTKTVRRDLN